MSLSINPRFADLLCEYLIIYCKMYINQFFWFKRQDDRQLSDYRKVSFSYGASFGHCEVCIGDTR